MRRTPQTPDFEPRKRPTQERSRVTYDALVEACARLLPERGFAATTTNHIAERAGVGVASLYEYFPGKDAIVAQVAARLVDRVLARLAEATPALLAEPETATRRWIELVHDTVAREGELLAVFVHQVPYTGELDVIRALEPRLLAFSIELGRSAGVRVGREPGQELTPAGMQLLINLVTSTILQVVLNPPEAVSERELLDELVARFEAWLR